MKLDLTRVLKSVYGEDLVEASTDADGKVTRRPLTIRSVLISTLITRVEGDSTEVSEQVERFMLATQAATTDEIELDSGQVTNIKKWIAARSAPLVTGQMCLILEGKLPDPDEV